MRHFLLIDEFHLSLRAPQGLDDSVYLAIRAVVDSKPFQADLRRAVREILHHYPPLQAVKARLSR